MRELRKITMVEVQKGTDLLDLPVVFTGTMEECSEHARSLGCVWKDSRKYLFGGYWHKPATPTDEGYCLNIT
jgi:hypothetical protein